jgi:heme-degrading monooxygenase HmoA
MIIRMWRAVASAESAPRYVEFFRGTVEPELRKLGGFLGAVVLESPRDSGGAAVVDVVVQTRWTSMDAVKSFAGNHPSVAVIEPAAQRLLLEFDRHVVHFTVVHESSTATGTAA